ncbi:MAG TPA: O-antigen ligase family protein [Solirubrobacteraceae bacterium]|jgi:O-antigen ligase
MRPPVLSPTALVRNPAVFTAVLALGGVFAAFIAGVVAARSPTLAGAMAAAALFGPIALIDLPLALAAWTALLFMRLVPGIGLPFSMAGLLIAFAWVGAMGGRTGVIRATLGRMRPLVLAIAALMLWLATSVAWASNPDVVWSDLIYWVLAGVLALVVATTADSPARLKLICAAFVVGALLSVLVGLIDGGLTGGADAIDTAVEGRFASAQNDPNDLAAGLVAAIALAVGTLGATRNGLARGLLTIAVPLLVLGLAATQSRGGIVASLIAVVTALVVARERRGQVLLAITGVVTVAAFALATTPGALERVTTLDNGGNGRSELWSIAWKMSGDHPVGGVGLNQFREESMDYVREPGNLEFVELIVESPHIVHNAYLQMLAETGIVGLVLFLSVLALCLGASIRALRIAREAGRGDLTALAQGVVVAQTGFLAAMFFLSIGNDFRLWLLLGLGPGLLSAVQAATRSAAPAASLRA